MDARLLDILVCPACKGNLEYVKSASELSQSAVCILPGTTTLQNLEDYFKPRNIKYEAVVFENPDEWRNAFFSGRCDVITTDRSDLASVRAIANDPKQYVILPETISKEPLAPVVRQNDSNWRDIVSWTVNALIAAEEYGITKGNVDEQLKSKDPEVQRRYQRACDHRHAVRAAAHIRPHMRRG